MASGSDTCRALKEEVWASRPSPNVIRLERDNGEVIEMNGKMYYLEGVEPIPHGPRINLTDEKIPAIREYLFSHDCWAMLQDPERKEEAKLACHILAAVQPILKALVKRKAVRAEQLRVGAHHGGGGTTIVVSSETIRLELLAMEAEGTLPRESKFNEKGELIS